MGENIADLGGLTLALDAYHASLQGKPAPVIDGLTGDQRVFLGWAQAWAGKAHADAIRKPDDRAIRTASANIASTASCGTSTPGTPAFGVKPGDALYRARADKRARIW